MDIPLTVSLAFVAGFLSSLHCVGMCGPLVLAYASQSGAANCSGFRSVLSHLFYNSGRILSYSIAGGMVGLFGETISALRGFGTAFSGLIGIVTIVFAASILRGGSFVPVGDADGARGLGYRLLGLYRAAFGGLILKGSIESKFYIGLLTPFLPCGLLYGMLIRSAGAGNALDGALIMGAFGAGIVPALLVAGIGGSYLSGRTRQWADRIAALLLMLMGASLLWRAVMAGFFGGGHSM